MAQSIKLGNDVYIDASGVMMRASSSTQRKTLADWASGLVNILSTTVGGYGSKTLTLSNGSGGFMMTGGGSANLSGLYNIGCSATGTAYDFATSAATDLTITRSGATITIANANSNDARILILMTTGTISE